MSVRACVRRTRITTTRGKQKFHILQAHQRSGCSPGWHEKPFQARRFGPLQATLTKSGTELLVRFFFACSLPRRCADGEDSQKQSIKLRFSETLLRSFIDTRPVGMRQKKKRERKPDPNGDAELPQGCSGAPKIHAAIQEVNKLKERQKEGGWPLINRRSHALRLSFPTYVCQCCYFGHFFFLFSLHWLGP